MILSLAGGLAAMGGLSATAQATFFSFASDVNSNGYTFGGTAGAGGSFSISDFSRPNTFTLIVDDNNGPLPSVSIPVEFHASLTANAGASTQISGSLYQHNYRVTGSFSFVDMMGNTLLTVTIGPSAGTLTVPGSQNAWSSVGAVLGADSFADVTYTASSAFVAALGGSATAAGYGITVGAGGTGSSVGPDDLAFDLTAINSGSIGALVALDPTTHTPTSLWRAESSYSGTAFGGIPSPGSCGLVGLGGVLVFGRRRR